MRRDERHNSEERGYGRRGYTAQQNHSEKAAKQQQGEQAVAEQGTKQAVQRQVSEQAAPPDKARHVFASKDGLAGIFATHWPRYFPLYFALLSALLLAGAFAFEYLGGLAPCPLCWQQRYVHAAVVIAGLILAVSGRRIALSPWPCIVLFALYALSATIAARHAGLEYGWWEAQLACTGSGFLPTTTDLRQALVAPASGPSCDAAPWQLFGISMAGYNAIISMGSAVILAVLAAIRCKLRAWRITFF